MNLAVPASSELRCACLPGLKSRRISSPRILKPIEYGTAVQGYSQLATGAGQNHVPLGGYLTSNEEPTLIQIDPSQPNSAFVKIYPLEYNEQRQTSASSSSPTPLGLADVDTDPDSSDERHHEPRKSLPFWNPQQFYRHALGRQKPQSCIIFMRGWLTTDWINNIGARHVVDPDFWARHLDFRPTDDGSSNFSVPALPSTSWHLMELPIITIGIRRTQKGEMDLEKIANLRAQAAKALEEHHHQVSKLASSGMSAGDSMIREFHVFDETHVAVEQKISVCMQTDDDGNIFSLLIWLDSGRDYPHQHSDPKLKPVPWAVHPPDSYFLPTIRHKHMVGLKCHLFQTTSTGDNDDNARQDHSASVLSADYGRTLRPEVMARDAMYALSEVLSFTASSQMQFLNLIDIKLEKKTSLPPAQDLLSLPNLKYLQKILYGHIQKTQRILDSINNTKSPKWPKDKSLPGRQRADAAVQSLEQDFRHLLKRTETLHDRTAQAITTLMSSISITEAQRAREQATRISKLTFLAFVFVPLSFTSSFFGMNVTELAHPLLGLKWWVVMTTCVVSASLAVLFIDVVSFFVEIWDMVKKYWDRWSDWGFWVRLG